MVWLLEITEPHIQEKIWTDSLRISIRMCSPKLKDYINSLWKLDKDISKGSNFIWTFMVTLPKRIFLHMDPNTVSKISITLSVGYFPNLLKISILFLALKTQTSKLLKAKRQLHELICYGNLKYLWFIHLKYLMECMKQKINKIFYWPKIF